MMRFIFKLIFYGFLALAILPSFMDSPSAKLTDDQNSKAQDETQSSSIAFSSMEALQLAGSVAIDVKSICTREPYVCETGQKIVIATLERARDGAQIVAGMIENHREKRRSESNQNITGSIQ